MEPKSNRLKELERRIVEAVKRLVHERKQKPKYLYLSLADHELLIGTNRERRTWHQRNYVGGLEVRISHNARGRSSVATHGCYVRIDV